MVLFDVSGIFGETGVVQGLLSTLRIAHWYGTLFKFFLLCNSDAIWLFLYFHLCDKYVTFVLCNSTNYILGYIYLSQLGTPPNLVKG